MNYQDCITYLTSKGKFSIELGLDRMIKIAEIFANPQDELKIIHVAGTNGKGSTCAMLAKILEANGFNVGLYTSPHIKSYTERFKINFQNMPEEDFAKYLELVETTAKRCNIDLKEFEILTMMAFLYFRDKKVDYLVLEVGMGGRLDATNIIKNPILTIITSVSLDHLDRLGKTIEEIAAEKAGILKENAPFIISKNNSGYKTIKTKSEELGIKILTVEKDFELIDTDNNIFSNCNKEYKISLKGINQGQNLALIDKACEYLDIKPFSALENVVWNSRFQYIKKYNLLVDAAHNPDAVKLLGENLAKYYPNQKRLFLFGVLNTKDYKKIISNLFRENDEIYVIDKFAPNAVDGNILLEEIHMQFPKIKIKLFKLENVKHFLTQDFIGIKICCGSFYICSQVLLNI